MSRVASYGLVLGIKSTETNAVQGPHCHPEVLWCCEEAGTTAASVSRHPCAHAGLVGWSWPALDSRNVLSCSHRKSYRFPQLGLRCVPAGTRPRRISRSPKSTTSRSSASRTPGTTLQWQMSWSSHTIREVQCSCLSPWHSVRCSAKPWRGEPASCRHSLLMRCLLQEECRVRKLARRMVR